jgi:hypothetical protein
LIHLLQQIAAGTTTVTRAELDRRSTRYGRLVLVRPDGYLVAALSGTPLERTRPIAPGTDGRLRAGPYELGRFYYSNGGVAYNADDDLNQVGGPIDELGLQHDIVSSALDGAEDALVSMARALAQLIRHPIQTIQGLAQLPGAMRQLIANSPEYWELLKAMPLNDQVRKVSELVTSLTLMYGADAGTTTRLAAAAADLGDVTVNVLRLQATGALAVEQVAVPVGTVATALSGGPGGVMVLAMANNAAGGSGGAGAGGGAGGGIRAPLTNAEAGRVVGWGTGQSAEAVQQTVNATRQLTPDLIRNMIQQGLTREWVATQLQFYEAAVASGGQKLVNQQLLVRRELMLRLLELWP